MTDVGKRISELRKAAGWTQAELGWKLNISAQAVSKWENGLSEPDIETLKQMCDMFGVSLDEIAGVSGMSGKERSKELVEEENKLIEKIENVVASSQIAAPKVIVGYCERCKKPIYQGEIYNLTTHKSRGGHSQSIYCNKCDLIQAREKVSYEYNARAAAMKKALIWSPIISIVVGLILFLSLNSMVGTGGGIGLGVGMGILIYMFVFGLFISETVQDIMLFFLRSFRMPGVIFTLDLDGIIWLITVKLTFAILSAMLSVAVFLIGVVFTGACSLFIFPFAISKYRKAQSTCNLKIESLNNRINAIK